jgi:hypothetical protein
MRIFIGLTPAFALLLAPQAIATEDLCSIYLPAGYETVATFPEDGAVGVPTNALLWIGMAHTDYREDADYDDFELEVYSFEPNAIVSVLVTRIGGNRLRDQAQHGFTLVRPEDNLLPNTDYEVHVQQQRVLSFTTGDGPDTAAPSVPVVEAGEVAPGRYQTPFTCSSGARANVSLSGDGELYVIDTATEPVSGPESLGEDVLMVTHEDSTWVPLGRDAEEQTIFVGSFDMAGNFSGWSEATRIDVPPPTCACVTAPERGAPAGLALMIGLSLLAARVSSAGPRRRRR